MEYCLDLTNFYENTSEKSLLNGSIIEIPKKIVGSDIDNPKYGSYVVEKWNKGGSHCFIFICITPGKRIVFAAKPSDTEKAIKLNKIIVTKHI